MSLPFVGSFCYLIMIAVLLFFILSPFLDHNGQLEFTDIPNSQPADA